MACIPGRLARIEVDFGSGFVNLGGAVDISLNGNVDELECTSHDSNGIREFIPNHSDFTMDSNFRWDEDEPAQVDLISTIFPTPTVFDLHFVMEQVSGRRQVEASAFATTWSPNANLDDTAGLDLSLRLSGVTVTVLP